MYIEAKKIIERKNINPFLNQVHGTIGMHTKDNKIPHNSFLGIGHSIIFNVEAKNLIAASVIARQFTFI